MSWDMFSLSSVVDDMARPLPLRGSSAGLLAIRRHIRRIIGLIVEDTRPTPPRADEIPEMAISIIFIVNSALCLSVLCTVYTQKLFI
jgi:hypothetical protein